MRCGASDSARRRRSSFPTYPAGGCRPNSIGCGDRTDLILIDSPPQVDTDARLAIRGADLVLVPLQPSPPDLWAAGGTLELAAGEGRAVRLVFNRAAAASRMRTQIEGEIAARHLPLLAASLGNRAPFVTAFAQGLGVCETVPRSVAARELAALIEELEGT